MILDYRLAWNREWLIANCSDERYVDYIHGISKKKGKPILTPTGRIKSKSLTYKLYIEDQEAYFDLLDWLHFEAAFVGQWVIVTEAHNTTSCVVAVVDQRDATLMRLKFDQEPGVANGWTSRIRFH